jgi:hypothetical protein
MGERVIKAFALAPLPVVVPLLLATGVNAVVGDTGDATSADIFVVMLALVLLSYGATFFVGIPVHFVLRRFRRAALIDYLSLTVAPFVLLAGAIAVWRLLAPAPAPPVNPFGLYAEGGTFIKWILAFAAVASLSAATFWYVGVRQPKS